MVTIAPRRFAPAPPADAGEEPPGPVMGDPLSVPEAELDTQPAEYCRYEPELRPEPLWVRLAPELTPYFDLGFVHDDIQCPTVVLRVRDEEDLRQQVELSGPPEAFLELASVISSLCRSVPCIAHRASAEAPQRMAG